jgi:curli biogenesis system outer membrane secretion channel CsgG
MKLRLTLILPIFLSQVLLLGAAFSQSVSAKSRVIISRFEDKSATSRCNLHKIWKTDLGYDFQRQMISVLSEFQQLRVLNKEFLETGKVVPAQFSIQGTLRNFEQCGTPGAKGNQPSRIAIEIRVIDVRTGEPAYTYTADVNASGPAILAGFTGGDLDSRTFTRSSIGQATRAAITDLAFRIDSALMSHKIAVKPRVVKPNRKIAKTEYEVKLLRREK